MLFVALIFIDIHYVRHKKLTLKSGMPAEPFPESLWRKLRSKHSLHFTAENVWSMSDLAVVSGTG